MPKLAKLRNAQSRSDLARILGFKPSALSFILYKLPAEKRYKKFSIPKRSGGERLICAPDSRLKLIQRRLATLLRDCCEEINEKAPRKSLSHAFRRKHSIITNARAHKRQRYVLNLDLADFFGSINFGRVRGYFLANRDFALNEPVATCIAQIACFENSLPQGSPSSPVISNLIGHLLDIRLVRLAQKNGVHYSRYADDLTFSTSQRAFPPSIATQHESELAEWTPGEALTKAIESSGFAINPTKTRMHHRTSRQLVTGLTVNEKVNIRSEYYRLARQMCHRAFTSGTYTRSSDSDRPSSQPTPQAPLNLSPLAGIMSHVDYVKDHADNRKPEEKKATPTATRRLYKRFLQFQYFACLERPLVICEGKTDSIYLKKAIERLDEFHPQLGTLTEGGFRAAVDFFNYENRAHQILDIGGGSSPLRYFLLKSGFRKDMLGYGHRPQQHPVVILVDNDDGATKLFKVLRENYSITLSHESSDSFYHITQNLYFIKTPSTVESVTTCIESFFPAHVLATELDGKRLNLSKDCNPKTEYGKARFANRVVRAQAETIDFSGFSPLLKRLSLAITDHYSRIAPQTTG